jgi:hypothetical protein
VTSLADDLAGILCVDVSRRAAQAVTLACVICEAEGHPLNELQVSALIQASISCMDGLEADYVRHLRVDAALFTGGFSALLGGDDDSP